VLRVMAAPWLAFAGVVGILAPLSDFYGRPLVDREILLFWWGCSIVFALGFAVPARRKFFRHFREIAAHRYESPSVLAKSAEKAPCTAAKRSSPLPWLLRRHPVWISLAAVAVFSIVGILVHRAYWEHQLQARIDAIKSQQLPTKMLEIPRFYPPVPKSENAFAMLQEAGYLRRLKTRDPQWNLPSARFRHGLDATNRQRFEAVATNHPALHEALLALSKFTNAYIQPLNDYRYTHNYEIYGYVNLALANLFVAFDDRDAARIERNLEAAIHLVGLLRRQPLPYPQIISYNAMRRLIPVLEAVLFQNTLGDESLLRLQAMVGEIDSEGVLERRLIISRAFMLDPPGPGYLVGVESESHLSRKRQFMEAIGTRQQQRTRVLDLFDRALKLAAGPPYERALWASELDLTVDVNDQPAPALDKVYESSIREAILSGSAITANARLLDTALAIQRYFRRHASYPPTLEAMMPEFISSVPVDPFSRGALRWKLTSDGAVLYSVGPDLEENVGPPGKEMDGGDLAFKFY